MTPITLRSKNYSADKVPDTNDDVHLSEECFESMLTAGTEPYDAYRGYEVAEPLDTGTLPRYYRSSQG